MFITKETMKRTEADASCLGIEGVLGHNQVRSIYGSNVFMSFIYITQGHLTTSICMSTCYVYDEGYHGEDTSIHALEM